MAKANREEHPRLTKEEAFAVLDATRNTQLIPMFWGEPGVGKTSIVEEYCESRGITMVTLILSQQEAADTGGIPKLGVMIHPKTKEEFPVMEYALPEWFVEAELGEQVLVFMDELPTAKRDVQASVLNPLTSHSLRGRKFHKGVSFAAAGNPGATGTNAAPLAPPLANRCVHFTLRQSNEEYLLGYERAWGRKMSLTESMTRAMFKAFLKAHSDLIQDFPETAQQQGGPWPSMRTWDYAARQCAAEEEVGVKAGWPQVQVDNLLGKTVQGYVGPKAAAAYHVFCAGDALPDPNAYFDSTFSWKSIPENAWFAAVRQLLRFVIENDSKDMYNKAGDLLLQLAKTARGREVVGNFASQYALASRHITDKDAKPNKDLMKEFQDIIRKMLGK